MSKLMSVPFFAASSRMGRSASNNPFTDASCAIGSVLAKRELILIDIFVRGIGPR